MKTKIDIQSWNRKEHFEFYKNFADPNHAIVVNIDCTKAYHNSKELGEKFYPYYLHKIMKAVNAIDVFKYRIEHDDVFEYEIIHCAATVGREDHTFGLSCFMYDPDKEIFKTSLEKETLKVQQKSGLVSDQNAVRIDVVHFSAVPWISFTSLKHTHNPGKHTGIPKISTGKTFWSDDKLMMPVQIEVHHGLVDGWHLGLLADEIQKSFDEGI